MSQQSASTILICGISGIGKTRLLESVVKRFPSAVIWRASEIIGVARHVIDPERLRTLPIEEIRRSQELLVQGFEARRQTLSDALVLLDAHSVIDTESGLIDVPVEVAARLAPSGIVHVSDDVARILERRLADTQRTRPVRSLAQLAEYQRRSVSSCERYSAALNVPFIEIRSGDVEALTKAIQGIETVPPHTG